MIFTINGDSAERNQGLYGKDDCDFVYVPILKNAHAWGIQYFTKNAGFSLIPNSKENYKVIPQQKNFIIFLRDPIDRWCSGIAEYFWHLPNMNVNAPYTLDDKELRFVLDAVSLDPHTAKQINWLLGLSVANCITFLLEDPHFSEKVQFFTKNQINKKEMTHTLPANHKANESVFKKSIINQLQHLLKNNTKYLSRLKQYYACDFEIYNYIWFREQNVPFNWYKTSLKKSITEKAQSRFNQKINNVRGKI